MKYLSRPYLLMPAAVLAINFALAPPGAGAQTQFGQALHRLDPFISHSSTPGYLGVLVTDVDSEAVTRLRLKETRGALITLIDHDAPAGSTLRVNDVVTEINGQRIESAEQFGRVLREVQAGHSVAMVISREGAPVSLNVQLVDRKELQKAWKEIGSHNESSGSSSPAKAILPGGDATLPRIHASIFGSTLKVGAMVEPLTSQTAEYLGLSSGVLIKQIARKSEADAAGLKEHDVVLKVGAEPIATVADWDRAIRANEGKPVAITILRDRRQQVVTLQVDSKHKGEVHLPGLLPDGPESAELDAESTTPESLTPRPAAQGVVAGANCLLSHNDWSQLQRNVAALGLGFKPLDLGLDPQDLQQFKTQMDQFKNQLQQFGQGFKAEDLGLDAKTVNELRQGMDQLRQSLQASGLGLDPAQLQELQRQMQEFQKSMPHDLFGSDLHLKKRRLDQPAMPSLRGQQA